MVSQISMSPRRISKTGVTSLNSSGRAPPPSDVALPRVVKALPLDPATLWLVSTGHQVRKSLGSCDSPVLTVFPGNYVGDFTQVGSPLGHPTVAVVGDQIIGL